MSDLQREVVTGNIVHYSATLKAGLGQHEVIGIHRVVKESSPWRPKPTTKAILLGHGDLLNFKAAFFMGPDGGTAASSFATYLATNDVDVWGVDYRWAKVLPDVVDHTFMATWNLETDVRDVRIALAVARGVQGLTGSGAGKIDYLGYSRGGQIGYVLLQQETLMHPALRSVKGAVIVDVPLKTDDDAFRQTACQIAAQKQTEIASGVYADGIGQLVQTIGALAEADPHRLSPLPLPFPVSLTNRQVALPFGQTCFFAPYLSHYHLNASVIGSLGLAEDLVYTDADVFIDVMQNLSPYESNGTIQQGAAVVCSDDTPLDDHLGAVSVPLMYVGTQGGFGDYGIYTTTLLGSTNVELLNISLIRIGNSTSGTTTCSGPRTLRYWPGRPSSTACVATTHGSKALLWRQRYGGTCPLSPGTGCFSLVCGHPEIYGQLCSHCQHRTWKRSHKSPLYGGSPHLPV